LIVKKHAFVDGNKRIAAACFLLFLDKNNRLNPEKGNLIISNEALASLTMFVAVSNLGTKMSSREVKKLNESDASKLFSDPFLVLTTSNNISTIRFLKTKIKEIENEVLSHTKLKPEFEKLLTMPGIGKILGITIMLEVGDINRFPKVSNYSSYCRAVKSEKLSNKKKKGEGNRKNGNKYLAWAYVEAANFANRHYPEVQSFYKRKKAKRNGVVAIKALSNKLARASYYVMRDKVSYDAKKLFR
jgi:hypothetical protein